MLTPQQALEKHFGFPHFRAEQETVIKQIINDINTLLVMPTGSGKSLTYQLPALLQPGMGLVISPLIALMKDQVDRLVETGIVATYINSALPSSEINRRMRAVLEGDVKLLYIAPERLRNRRFTQALARTKISLLAVDEAHCISQWGHDFRPDYLHIGPIWQAMGQPTLLATTATATPTVQKDILRLLGVPQARTIVTGFNRSNLTFRVKHTPSDQAKTEALATILSGLEGSAIIYAATRRNADFVADFVQQSLGLTAQAYHAGLDRERRSQVQNDFMNNNIQVVVATSAFGMGIDKADIRLVIHYNLPATVETYYQQAGRAGRDRLPAECVLLYGPDDQRLQEWFIDSVTPTYEDLHQLHTLMTDAADEGELHVTAQELAAHSGFHPVKVRVGLSELEQAGLIFHLGNQGFYSSWKILPPSPPAMEQRIRAIQRRVKIRHQLFKEMCHYAHLTTCRRAYLLAYFGDNTPPQATGCCDNHTVNDLTQLPKATTPQEWLPLIVLETVRTMEKRPLGRHRLAKLLSGSQSRQMKQFGYTKHRFYGKLNHLSQKQILQLIDTMIQDRYLQLSGGAWPVVVITTIGLEALQHRAALPANVLL